MSEQQQTGAETGNENARRVRKLTASVRGFVASGGGAEGARGAVEHVGRDVHRIVLVGADGRWGDLVAASRGEAEAALREAGVEVVESLDGEVANRMRSGSYEWNRMAGLQLRG
ncbi:hypothetical protein BIV57_03150 [Mangrovactinospora gilvigrisea]|uniref:Uncharacterized protein n=1 Tax=Mangrovactinospora gilvigrisea TaxID=1428644 RepID=A0A1J7BK01_9ACTN|nr:hypothetical protein [Mangrovactinospora gilvigrisea]OIV38966.1 hypothetical protein BIV57_03150 [Mangrovactinospora gilvigrisea]